MRAVEFVESYFDAWNHCDPVAIANHLASNGLYYDVPENVQRTHDELVVSLGDGADEAITCQIGSKQAKDGQRHSHLMIKDLI